MSFLSAKITLLVQLHPYIGVIFNNNYNHFERSRATRAFITYTKSI